MRHELHDTRNNGWVDSFKVCRTKAPSNRGQRLTIIHEGWKEGWIANALLLFAKKKILFRTTNRIPRLNFLKIDFKIICVQIYRNKMLATTKLIFRDAY